jgi:transposase
MKFVSLEPEQWAELEATMQSPACDKRYWQRLYSVKLNAQGYTLAQISELLEVHYNSVYQWVTRYEEEGVAGLKDRPISGRPPLLSEADRQQVEAFIQETPQQPKVVLARVAAELGKSISRATLRRTLKALDHPYRRVKKSLRSKRDEQKFDVKKKNLKP